jgi:hypothetical protein
MRLKLKSTESLMRLLVWGGLFLVVLFDFVALNIMKIKVGLNTIQIAASIIAFMLFSYAFIKSSDQLVLKGNNKAAHAFQIIGLCFEVLNQFIVFIFSAVVFVYIMSASSRDLYDAEILSIDKWLGMDVVSVLSWVNQHPYINKILEASYLSYWQLPLVAVALIICNKSITAYKVILCLTIAATVCSVISYIFPAVAPFVHLNLNAADYPNVNMISGYHHLHDYLGMRDGTLKSLDLLQLKGVITFPSTHASIAVIMLWGFWHIPYLRWPLLVFNLIALVSIPITGGHYLTDAIFGVIIAVMSILLVNRIEEFVENKFKPIEN